MVESLPYVFYDDLELPVDRSEGVGSWEDAAADYVDVIVLEVVQQLGVRSRRGNITLL